MRIYTIQKDPADPFRENWYIQPEIFSYKEEAAQAALQKAWEGFMCIQKMLNCKKPHPNVEDGCAV